MKIEIKKFGTFLVSRPEGRDAFLVIKHQFLPRNPDKTVELDFDGVKVCAPSWLDEVVTGIADVCGKENIVYVNTDNSSVKASLEMVLATL